MNNNSNKETELDDKINKKNNKKSKIILLVLLILLLIPIIAIAPKINLKEMWDKKNETIHNDYVFNTGNKVEIRDDNLSTGKEVGLSVKVIHYLGKDGDLELTIKNTGTLNTKPRIIFEDKVIYTGPSLKPNQAVTTNVKFGKLEEGEYKFNVIGNQNEEDINSTGVMLECILRVEK